MKGFASIILLRQRVFYTDILVLVLAYLLPSFSHLTSFPLYLFDPMRLLVLAGYFLSGNRANGIFLAATIPLFSLVTSGHPIFFKALLISIELVANILLISIFLRRKKWPAWIALFLSIVLSKLFYYALKFLFITILLIEGDLISTGIHYQLISAVVISTLFALYFRTTNRNPAS